jgi:hypothetical protein
MSGERPVCEATQCVVLTTFGAPPMAPNISLSLSAFGGWVALTDSDKRLRVMGGEIDMQMVITLMAVVGGMVFSLAVALLAEELIFGQVVRLFFVRQTVSVKTENKR